MFDVFDVFIRYPRRGSDRYIMPGTRVYTSDSNSYSGGSTTLYRFNHHDTIIGWSFAFLRILQLYSSINN